MAAPSDEAGDDEDGGWKYSLEDLEDDADGERADREVAASDASQRDADADDERIDRSIEPGTIDLENAAFVALGVLVGALILLRTAMLFTG